MLLLLALPLFLDLSLGAFVNACVPVIHGLGQRQKLSLVLHGLRNIVKVLYRAVHFDV